MTKNQTATTWFTQLETKSIVCPIDNKTPFSQPPTTLKCQKVLMTKIHPQILKASRFFKLVYKSQRILFIC